MFKLEIETDYMAPEDRDAELVRLLRDVVEAIVRDGREHSRALRDSNGKVVGEFWFVKED